MREMVADMARRHEEILNLKDAAERERDAEAQQCLELQENADRLQALLDGEQAAMAAPEAATLSALRLAEQQKATIAELRRELSRRHLDGI